MVSVEFLSLNFLLTTDSFGLRNFTDDILLHFKDNLIHAVYNFDGFR
jgi:hypothetical protein